MTHYGSAPFTEPVPRGYLYAGLRVDPPRHVPFVRRSAKRAEVLDTCVAVAEQLARKAEVVNATVYEAVVIPPARGGPRFDVFVLVQTTSVATIPPVQTSEAFQSLPADLVMPARNLRRIGDIDRTRAETFLFNHFTSTDPDGALHAWEDIAGWFTHKADVDDSALLGPVGESPYVFVNHVRLPTSPLRFFLRLARPSFRKAVSRRLRANRIDFAAVVCRPVRPGR